MALTRFISQSCILASTLFTGFLIYSNPARADVSCIVADNGKAICGTPISIQRMCILADNKKTICGKFTTNKKDDESQTQSSSQQVSNPYKGSSYRKEVDNFILILKDCQRSDINITCNFVVSRKDNEKRIEFFSGLITDATGKSYGVQGAKIGGSNAYGQYISIAPGINYNGTFSFNVPEGINQVPLLKMGSTSGTFQFRNIAFSN